MKFWHLFIKVTLPNPKQITTKPIMSVDRSGLFWGTNGKVKAILPIKSNYLDYINMDNQKVVKFT